MINLNFRQLFDKAAEMLSTKVKEGVAVIGNAFIHYIFKAPTLTYHFQCVGADGQVKWEDGFSNLVTTPGKNDFLTQYFKGSAYTAAWYLGLVDNASFSAIAAGDTAASHAGWLESTAYSNSNRPTLAFGTASADSLATSSAASFTINATATINGAFTITNNTKGGTSGLLYSAGSFSATRAVANGDTLNVSVTVSA